MNRKMLAAVGAFGALTALAGPAVKMDSVAPGFPVWEGVTDKNYVAGRQVEPSDLRHKVTILVEVEPGEKMIAQLLEASKLVARASNVSLGFGANWEDAEMPRDVIAVLSVRGLTPKSLEEVAELLAGKGKKLDKDTASSLSKIKSGNCAVYRDLSYAGAPETEGKRPYVHVFGPTGAEPLCHGQLPATLKDANAAIAKGRKEISGWDPKWRPFYGYVADPPKFNTSIAKVLEKGKKARKAPMVPVMKALLTDIKSKDEEKAKEAQILYDALVQTRDDLILRIDLEASACPHRAYYDIQNLLKYWPMETKRVEAAMARMKSNPEVDMMGKMFTQLMEWSDPAYTCKNESEAKKNIQALNKMKKALAGPKESKTISIQNGALLLDMKVDSLISEMPSKVPAK